MAKATTRIYSVANGSSDERLVRASNQAQALRHVAASTYTVAVAGQELIVSHLTAGGKIEDANSDEEQLDAFPETPNTPEFQEVGEKAAPEQQAAEGST